MTPLRLFIGALLVCAIIAGCGSEAGPVTSQTSKYEVGEDSAAPAGSPPAPSSVASFEPPADQGTFNPRSKASSVGADDPPTRPRTTPPERPTPDISATNPNVGTPATSPPVPMPDNPEEATPQQLLALIDSLQNQQPRRGPQAQVIAEFKEIQAQIIRAAEVLLSKDADDEALETAVSAKVSAMSLLVSLKEVGVRQQQFEFAEALKKDKRPVLVKLGRRVHFRTLLEAFSAGEAEGPEEVVEGFQALPAFQEGDPSVLEFAPEVAGRVFQRGFLKEGAAVLRFAAEQFKENEDAEVAAVVNSLLEQAGFADAGLNEAIAAAVEEKPGAVEEFSKVINSLVTSEYAGQITFGTLAQLAAQFETEAPNLAVALYDSLESGFSDHPDQAIVAQTKKLVEKFRERIAIIGQPFVFDGVLADGTPFDAGRYKGKVVLVDFWATWCGPCLEELPNIKKNFDLYNEHGFEVVGVNIDQDRDAFTEFMKFQPLPWPSVLSPDPQQPHPMAEKYAVTAIPFLVLLDTEGKVMALNTRGPRLGKELAKLFPDVPVPGAAAPAEPPPSSDDSGAAAQPADEDQPSEPAAGTDTSQLAAPRTFFVALNQQERVDEGEPESTLDLSDVNPYAAPQRLTRGELVEFLLNMKEKPKSIQRRAGFSEAVVDAADRILAANVKDNDDALAVVAKLEALHKQALDGDDADRKLMSFVRTLSDDSRKKIVRLRTFYELESRLLDTAELTQDELRELLVSVSAFAQDARLDQRHLRLASSAVGAINRLQDADEREKYFQQFGGIFSTSRDKELASYGRRVAGTKARQVVDLVGKSLELSGTTALGTGFDWSSYRGRVVLVDFWATWCGPCRREMPAIKKLLDEHQDKGLDVVAISLDRDLKALSAFLEEEEIFWTNLVGEDAIGLAKKHGIVAVPTMFVVDGNGKVVAVGHGVEELQGEVEQLLAQK